MLIKRHIQSNLCNSKVLWEEQASSISGYNDLFSRGKEKLHKKLTRTQSTQVCLLHFASTLFYISKTPPSSCWHIYVQNRLIVMPATKHSL